MVYWYVVEAYIFEGRCSAYGCLRKAKTRIGRTEELEKRVVQADSS
jgi:hypothetical protein